MSYETELFILFFPLLFHIANKKQKTLQLCNYDGNCLIFSGIHDTV